MGGSDDGVSALDERRHPVSLLGVLVWCSLVGVGRTCVVLVVPFVEVAQQGADGCDLVGGELWSLRADGSPAFQADPLVIGEVRVIELGRIPVIRARVQVALVVCGRWLCRVTSGSWRVGILGQIGITSCGSVAGMVTERVADRGTPEGEVASEAAARSEILPPPSRTARCGPELRECSRRVSEAARRDPARKARNRGRAMVGPTSLTAAPTRVGTPATRLPTVTAGSTVASGGTDASRTAATGRHVGGRGVWALRRVMASRTAAGSTGYLCPVVATLTPCEDSR